MNGITRAAICSAMLLTTPAAMALDRFMAMTGTDTANDCSNEATPCATLQHAMSQMLSGDTLYIDDGEYTSANHTINQFNVPPSGTPDAYTVVRAKNIPCHNGIPCNEPLRVKFTTDALFSCQNNNNVATYVKFWGIRWNGIATYTGWDHIYFKQVASHGVNDGNSVTIGISGRNNLLEDVVAFGKGRYKFLFYDVSRTGVVGNNLCRRCIARHDWAMRDDIGGEPIAAFSSYYNRGTACINCIIIDSDTPSQWQNIPTEISGAFYQPVDDGPHAMIINGSIVLNTAMAVTTTRQLSSGHIYKDIAAVKTAGGLHARGESSFNNLTLVDVGIDNFSYRSADQLATVIGPDDGMLLFGGDGPATLNNSIFSDIAGSVIQGSGVDSNHLNTWQIGGVKYIGSLPPATETTTSPHANGLRYPVRVEPGSALASQAENGGAMGAEILYKLGQDGSFKNDTNWDSKQGPLWPWPLEEWVKAEMRTSNHASDPTRGFAADSESLSNYIWGYLGNTVPPFGVRATYHDNSSVTVSWNKPATAALGTITGFNIYDVAGGDQRLLHRVSGNSSYSATLGGLEKGRQYQLAVTATDSIKGESGYVYTDTVGSALPPPLSAPTGLILMEAASNE